MKGARNPRSRVDAGLAASRYLRMAASSTVLSAALVTVLSLGGTACEPADPGPPAPFPADYESSWTETRDPCRLSHDHQLRYIRVFADELAAPSHLDLGQPYPVGAKLLKAEYDDEACESLVSFVVMEKLRAGADPVNYDWDWSRWSPGREYLDRPDEVPRLCVGCHEYHCSELPFGYDLSCAPDLEP